MSSYTVRLYTQHNWPHIAPLVDALPFKPLAGHARWNPQQVAELSYARIKDSLGKSEGGAWVALKETAVHGFASFCLLPWDSEQLGMCAARLDHLVAIGTYQEQHRIKSALIEKVVEEAFQQHVWHLSARVDASDLSGLHALEQANFITVDAILTFALDLARFKFPNPEHNFHIRLATAEDAERVANLARVSYVYDRFHADPIIKMEHADELHAAWLRNSCQGKAADAVIIAEDKEGPLGYVTCKLQPDTEKHLGRMVGTIVLVATAERARGRGVGQATTLAALKWFQEQGAGIVEVGTQLRNTQASRLYQRCGFHLVGSSISLRKSL